MEATVDALRSLLDRLSASEREWVERFIERYEGGELITSREWSRVNNLILEWNGRPSSDYSPPRQRPRYPVGPLRIKL
jgi:hypothetical protein